MNKKLYFLFDTILIVRYGFIIKNRKDKGGTMVWH